jgi:hypothetical protein
MAVRKDELPPPKDQSKVDALAELWEMEIDAILKGGARTVRFCDLSNIRTCVSQDELWAARYEIERRYEAAGWKVSIDRSMDPAFWFN